jgi:hypothetical protein
VLGNIEIKMSGDESLIPNPEALTVEHILPKKPDSKWPPKMRQEAFVKEHCNRIGNLTILTEPMNKDCESKPFAFKRKIYDGAKYKITKAICAYEEWDPDAITDRQARLAEVAASVWVI